MTSVAKCLTIVNERGLHARASAKFVATVEAHDAEARVSRDGHTVGGDSIMGLLMLAAAQGATIEVENDGAVHISTTDGEAAEQARAEIEALAAEIKVGSVYEGKVVSIKDFGAFIELAPGTDGMCHISELDSGYVDKVEDVVKMGDTVKVKVINVDDSGRIKLSRKALMGGGDADDSDGDGDGGGGGGRGRDGGGGGKRRGGGRGKGRREKQEVAKS